VSQPPRSDRLSELNRTGWRQSEKRRKMSRLTKKKERNEATAVVGTL